MDKYRVMLYPEAYRNIDDIYAYIALEKMSPENAQKQTDRIWDALESLSDNPESHQERLVGRYSGMGYRQLLIDNYLAIFKVDRNRKTVYVITVQFQGRNI